MGLMGSDISHADIEVVRREIMRHESNAHHTVNGYVPLFAGSSTAKIVIIGQAPGVRAQTSAKPWDDASGERLMRWLGMSEAEFRNEALVAHMPMDFYYPGKGRSGDLPPRKDFAAMWHPRLMAAMPNIELKILVGSYAQRYYLNKSRKATLTQTVLAYHEYLPEFFPLVHPSPLNFRWFAKNPWFEMEVVPELQRHVRQIIR